MTPETDEHFASRVKDALDELQRAVSAAEARGIIVEISVEKITRFGIMARSSRERGDRINTVLSVEMSKRLGARR